jgi:hypothetical protein
MKTANAADFVEFSDSDFNAADEADMAVVMNGQITTWIWTFAGPGHPKTVEIENRAAREQLRNQHQIEQQRLNGKKVKVPEQTVDEIREKNVDWIVDRLLRWSPVRINGEDYAFSPENARALLSDRKKVNLFSQALEFLSDTESFTQRSAAI